MICPCGRNHLPLCPHCLWLMLLLSGCLWRWNCLARQRDCSKQTQLLLSGGAKNITMLSSEIKNTHTYIYIYVPTTNFIVASLSNHMAFPGWGKLKVCINVKCLNCWNLSCGRGRPKLREIWVVSLSLSLSLSICVYIYAYVWFQQFRLRPCDLPGYIGKVFSSLPTACSGLASNDGSA